MNSKMSAEEVFSYLSPLKVENVKHAKLELFDLLVTLPIYLEGNMFVVNGNIESSVAAESKPIGGMGHPELLFLDTRKPVQHVNKIRLS